MTTINLQSSMAHRQLSSVPLIVKFFSWFRENRQATYDLIGLFILSFLTYFIFHFFNFTEAFFAFTRSFEALQLDEVILVSATVVPFYLAIFAVRRWIESDNRLHQANTDSLTGLYNRRKGREVLDFEVRRSRRYNRPLSIIMLDLDHFKEINDRHGHLAGDRVLRLVARTIQEQIRSTDILMRWGGEEFIIVSVETDQDEARQLAERLRAAIEASPHQNNVHPTGSFGITQLQDDDTFDSFLRRVDDKLYEAKFSGRNKVI